MGFDGRIFGKGEKPHVAHRSYLDLIKYLKIGKVEAVDPDRLVMMVSFGEGESGPSIEMPITFPYAGPSGIFGPLPEKGAKCICGAYDEGDGTPRPLVLAYLPTGLKEGYEFNRVKNTPDALPSGDDNRIMYRFKPMSKGDVNMTSPEGGGISINKGATLSDYLNDSITVRPSDQSIISTSVNNFIFADGVSLNMGPAMRNSKVLLDGNGARIEGTLCRETSLSDGREAVYIVPHGKKIDANTQYYSEFRVDVDELCDGVLDNNDINGISVVSTRNPIATLTLGNFIMADPSDPSYGDVVRPILFNSIDDDTGSFDLVSCTQNKGVDEVSSIGLAFAVYEPQVGGFMGLDKEGHFYMNLPGSSTSNPLGAGRSMSLLASGNLKEIWGGAPEDNNAWDLTAKGGIRWSVGTHNELGGGNSIEIRASGNTYVEAGGNQIEKVYGHSTADITGGKTETVGGQYDLTVVGLKKETVYGSSQGKFMADYSIHTFGKFAETAMLEKQCKFGKRKTSIVNNDETDITLGNLTEEIKVGQRKTTITTGSIVNNITTGNMTNSVKTGKYGVDVKAGNLNFATKAGTARLESKLATTIAALSVVAEGSTVKLGKGPAKSGLVTGAGAKPSHFDYVTGSPLKGSVTVTSA